MTTLDHADIRWRVSNTWDKGDTKMGMLVGYIDSRTAMEALDVLDEKWSSKMEPISLNGESGIRCTLVVNDVAREDVGVASNTEPLKGAFSDALKRAAVHHGIGRELYELPKIAVECEVDKRTGKAKAPKALPIFKNGRWEIDRQFGWVKYEREPNDQPEQRGPAKAAPTPNAAPVRTPEEQMLLDMILAAPGMTHARMSLLADAVGVVKGERATADQLREMLARIEQQPDSLGSGSATVQAVASPPGDEPARAPTLDDVLEAAGPGAELVPPAPGSDAFKALDSKGKLEARVHHQTHSEEVAV